jgi:hypothetical protein
LGRNSQSALLFFDKEEKIYEEKSAAWRVVFVYLFYHGAGIEHRGQLNTGKCGRERNR